MASTTKEEEVPTEKLPVHAAIASILNKLQPIGKEQRNKDQNYNFRGIDDVLKKIHPLFAEHGVFMTPDVVEREYEERTSKSGNTGHCAHLHVRWTVYGPQGDSLTFSTWGEGLDYSDKATNKAMTAAFKYALFELFAICDPDEDADKKTEEAGETTAATSQRSVSNPQGKRLVNQKQLNLINALFDEKNFPKDRDYRHRFIVGIIERDFGSSKELFSTEASKTIDALRAHDVMMTAREEHIAEMEQELGPDEARVVVEESDPIPVCASCGTSEGVGRYEKDGKFYCGDHLPF